MTSLVARPPVNIRAWVANGKAPTAELDTIMNGTLGYAILARSKQIFHRYSPITAIPASAGTGARTRWRFAWHSAPHAVFYYMRMMQAPQDGGAVNDCYSVLDINIAGSSTVVATANVHYGSSDGSLDDVPWNINDAKRVLEASAGGVYPVVGDTEYEARCYDVNEARMCGLTVWEITAEDLVASFAVGSPIFDAARGDLISNARSLYGRHATPLWHGGSESNSTARSVAATSSISGSLSQTVPWFALTATGTVEGDTFTAIPRWNYGEGVEPEGIDNGSNLDISVDVTFGGAQTNAEFTLRAFINPSSTTFTPSTIALDGWSESGWTSVGSARLNTFTKASVDDLETATIQVQFAVTGSTQVFVYTNNPSDGDPFTDQCTGTGDVIAVQII